MKDELAQAIISREKIKQEAGDLGLQLYDEIHQAFANAKLYKSAWVRLASVFGEQINQEALDIMEAVISGVKLELEVNK